MPPVLAQPEHSRLRQSIVAIVRDIVLSSVSSCSIGFVIESEVDAEAEPELNFVEAVARQQPQVARTNPRGETYTLKPTSPKGRTWRSVSGPTTLSGWTWAAVPAGAGYRMTGCTTSVVVSHVRSTPAPTCG